MREDLFQDAVEDPIPEAPETPEHSIPPSESVYCDIGTDELHYIGEVQVPRPVPVELIVTIDGWDYVYKLDRRIKDSE